MQNRRIHQPPSRLDKETFLRISGVINEISGLNFTERRFSELQSKLKVVSSILKMDGIEPLVEKILSRSLTDRELDILIRELTVGETFFFRDAKVFKALQERIIPEIIARKRNTDRKIRMLSAGCSTGEEPYSAAMLLRRFFPITMKWDVKIIGVDINMRSLETARRGVYKKWAFRGAPEWAKELFFKWDHENGYRISEEIKGMVEFGHFNLAQGTGIAIKMLMNFDIIFCRNVIMYFDEPTRQKAVNLLYDLLVNDGWLMVSPVEISASLFSRFHPEIINNVRTYRKQPVSISSDSTTEKVYSKADAPTTLGFHKVRSSHEFKQGDSLKLDVVLEDGSQAPLSTNPLDIKTAEPARQTDEDIDLWIERAQKYADTRMFKEAAAILEDIILNQRLKTESYYLLALVYEEMGDRIKSEETLRKVIYIDQRSPVARFRLGSLLLRDNKLEDALREFRNVISILEELKDDHMLVGLEDINVARLLEMSMSIVREIEIR